MATGSLKIGMIAPPWLPVPPHTYGGTELVIDALCVGLRDAGHDVTLFTTGDSTCPVRKRWLFEQGDPDRMGMAVIELRHVSAAYEALADLDIVHDHTVTGLFYNIRYPDLPVVATNHGPFNEELNDLLGRVAGRIPLIAISDDQASRAPQRIPVSRVIAHGIDLDRYRPSYAEGDHLLFLGRMSPDKGVDVAVRVAKRVGVPLLIAAKMREPQEFRFFREVVEPMLDDTVRFLGEVDFANKVRLLRTARALINPITWPEPFGLVMIEALACGTPVVGFGAGAAPEIIENAVTGFLVGHEDELVEGVIRVGEIDRRRCRQVAAERFSAARMASDHIRFYRDVIAGWPLSSNSTPDAAVGSTSPGRLPAAGTAGWGIGGAHAA